MGDWKHAKTIRWNHHGLLMKLKEVSTSDELKSWPRGILRFIKNTEAVSPVYGEFVWQMYTTFLKLSFPVNDTVPNASRSSVSSHGLIIITIIMLAANWRHGGRYTNNDHNVFKNALWLMKVVSGKKQNSSFPPFSQSLVSRDALHLTFPKEKRPEDGVVYLHRHHIISLPTFSVDFDTLIANPSKTVT